MIADILTVMWKERRERDGQQPGLRKKLTSLVIPIIAFGMMAIYAPLSVGQEWANSPFTLFLSALAPLMVVSPSIADSFAGERERKTLEALLATQLSDSAILFGKILVPFLKSLKITMLLHLLSLISVNIAYWNGSVMIYTLTIFLSNLSVCMLLSLGIACLGVFVSLRAETVQQATQSLMAGLLGPFLLLMIAIILIGTVLPDRWRLAFEQFFEEIVRTADFSQVILTITGILFVINLVLVVAALNRFQRTHLIF